MIKISKKPPSYATSWIKIPKEKKEVKPQQHSSIRRSYAQETEIAEAIGGKKTLASGSLDEKGDVRIKGVVRIEAKTTQYKSLSVTREMIGKIENAAVAFGEIPVIVVEFQNKNAQPVDSVCVIPKWALEMITQWKN